MGEETKQLWRKRWRLYRLEKKRLRAQKWVRLGALVCLCMPVLGLYWYQPATDLTATSLYLANPQLAAGLGGALVWMALTLLELDRMQRQHMEPLTEAALSLTELQVIKTAALLQTALQVWLVLLLLWLPWTMAQIPSFSIGLYGLSGVVLLLPCWLLAILLAVSCYQLTNRLLLAALLCAMLVFFSCGTWADGQYLLRWINPLVPVMSDAFSNRPALSLACYSRLCWFLLAVGLWLMSLLALRRYQLGLLQSVRYQVQQNKKVLLTALLCLSGAALCMAQEPFIDDSPLEPVFAEQVAPEDIFLQHSRLEVAIDGWAGSLEGTAEYVLHNRGTDAELCSFQIDPGYTISAMLLDGQSLTFTDLHNDVDNAKTIEFLLPAGEGQRLTILYSGQPKIWSILRDSLMGGGISNRYVELSNSKLGPKFSLQREAEHQTEFYFTLPDHLVPVTNGQQLERMEQRQGNTLWRSVSQEARVNLYAAEYVKQTMEEAGMYVNFYYPGQQQQSLQQMGALEQIARTLHYCAAHYGPLPFDRDNPLQLVEESAYAMGGGAFGNFSVMGETIFSPQSLDDAARGASGAEVLAHEIVHQWWGLSWMFWDEGPWSSEGMTCYTTYRMMKEQYGTDYARQYYVEEWKQGARQLQKSYYYRHPELLEQLPEAYRANLIAEQESISRYAVMPLLLLQAEQLLGGEEAMDAVLSQLFANGGQQMPGYLTWQDFLQVSGLTEEVFDLDQAVLL